MQSFQKRTKYNFQAFQAANADVPVNDETDDEGFEDYDQENELTEDDVNERLKRLVQPENNVMPDVLILMMKGLGDYKENELKEDLMMLIKCSRV